MCHLNDPLLVSSIIKSSDFSSPEVLAQHLHYLVQHPNEYQKLLDWKKIPLDPNVFPGFVEAVELSVDTAHCRLCAALRPGRCVRCGAQCLKEQALQYGARKKNIMSWSLSHELALK